MKYFMVTKEKTKEMLSSFIKYLNDEGYIIAFWVEGNMLEYILDEFLNTYEKDV